MSYQINKDCNLCELYRDAKSVCIGGRGPEPAALLVVGQNPGYKEDRLGEPFVGESGTLLNRLLRDIEVTVRVTNAVKCYTPDNRKPSLTEQEACRVYLEKEISTCAPEAILALGNEALTSLTGQGGITKKRGKPLELRASIRASLGLATSPKVIATWHPAFILRDPSHLVEMEEDFAAVIRYIRSLRGEEQGETVVWKELASRKELHDLFETSSLIGYDIETNGAPLNSDELKVHMVGLSNGETTLVARSDLDYITTYMTKHSDKIVGYNSISFDDVAVSKVNRLAGIESGDAMYLDYLLDAGTSSYDGRMKGRHKLQSSVIRHLQIPPWKDEVVWSWAEFDSFKRDLWPIAALYNGRDCSYTVQLYRLLWPKLSHKQKLLITYLMNPAGRFLASIEKRGVPISLKNLQEVKLEVEVAKEKALDALVRHAFNFDMWTFNPNSHPQVRDLLFNKMKLVPSKYTTGGEPSTDEESIKSLLLSVDAKDAEVLASLLSYRGSTKLLGTYIENCVPEADGRIHTGYSLTQTTTGRTASYGWSTQRTPRDKRLRRIVAAPAGYKLLSYDLSQIEMRSMAFLSREPNMLSVYRDNLYGGDMHNYTAAAIAEVMFHRTEYTPDDRQIAKPFNFACLYGAEWFTIQAYLLQEYGIKLSKAVTIQLRDEMFFGRAFPGLPKYYDALIRKARQGHVEGVLGRKRLLPNINARDSSLQTEAARAAINTENQGLASDLALIGCIMVERLMPYIEQVAFNHDAGIALVKEELVNDELIQQLKYCFENEVREYLGSYFEVDFDVPLKLDVKVLDEWS